MASENKYSKYERLKLLRKIISEQEISDQFQLLAELKKHGIRTTQATISRDLKELGMVKVPATSGDYKYSLVDKESRDHLLQRLKMLFKNFVHEVRGVNNIALVLTSPGNAHSVSIVIDRLEYPQILGTVAGDDTILIVAKSDKDRKDLEREFNTILEQLP